ncbi:hypothetical protein [Rhizobium sullae]|uniref:hypothetical protein n=1 Tax=Rhizobium sullae TaxID=50338 RepID=UPI0015C6919A|nr:hypothetical protein [Rhizobium sullae]
MRPDKSITLRPTAATSISDRSRFGGAKVLGDLAAELGDAPFNVFPFFCLL